ncbi:transporter substrate-binding domain-containing protein [Campylobacter geochelonis]|uniref:Polar amino acid ABC uptake transporter substrate binding protein n=1 Tax=Campylobacter geochelonis TaxID=1780362 RepID=A0A128EGH9_9BACT|nr:transporter substrate-binding domain-containing protein [Campylobacter geochelonis]QKF70863.1 periplasmic substrate-binding protein [Campylobacter geochelonis]CZE47990.1 polar amino acid ABC uptake transporter substrate binding protein [Campylobacter geochelonis]
MKKILFCIFLLSASMMFAENLKTIQDKKVLRVGVFAEQPPFSTKTSDGYQGFEVELAQALASGIFPDGGGKIEFIGVKASDRITFLQNNTIDLLIATLTKTPEREELIDFSIPYFTVNLAILTRKADKITQLSDLADKTIIVEKNSIAEKYFDSKGYKLVTCNSAMNCYNLLKEGKGDGFVNDNLIVLAYPVIDSSVEIGVKNIGSTDLLGIGVQKGNQELLKIVNSELIKLSKGGFFAKAFNDTLDPFYKGTAEKKYFLLDDLYRMFM